MRQWVPVCAWLVFLAAAPAADLWFPVGETMEYRLHWGFVPIGSATVSSQWEELDGRRVIALRSWTRTNRVLDKIYPVDNRIEAFVDPETFSPLLFHKIFNEGFRHSDDTLVFDNARGTATWKQADSETGFTYPIPPHARDIFSTLYVIRTNCFVPGQTLSFDLAMDGKISPLVIHTHKIETVKLDELGPVQSIRMTVEAEEEGVFRNKMPRDVWVSVDDRRVITSMRVRAPIGFVKVMLSALTVPEAVSSAP